MNTLIYYPLLLSCCLYAVVRGGQPERIAVALLLSAVFASLAVHGFGSWRFSGFDPGVFSVDLVLFLFVSALSMHAQRYWPLWWAAVKLNTIVTHLLVLSPALAHWSYWLGNAVWSYPSPILIAIGAARHQYRIRRYGHDPAWSLSRTEQSAHEHDEQSGRFSRL